MAPSPEAFLAGHPDLREELIALLAERAGPGPRIERFRSGTDSTANDDPDAAVPPSDPTDGANVGSTDATGNGATISFEPTKDDPGASRDLPDGKLLRKFGDYELFRVLGRGGMGVVYEARQVSLNRPVAVKMIRDATFASDEERRRFRNEAEAVALLDHPGIVPIYEVGEFEGHRYFSMKLIGQGSLSGRLAIYRDDPKTTAAVLADVADAVQHAHMRGVLHRDLKPANILVDDQGPPACDRLRPGQTGRRRRRDDRLRGDPGHARLHGPRASFRQAGDRSRRPPTSMAWARSYTPC